MNIEKQKAIADEVLGCLETLCPHTILAGGAPRDWYLGNPANDLDIYIHLPPVNRSDINRMLLNVLPKGFEILKINSVEKEFNSDIDEHSKAYSRMKYLKFILNCSYKGQDIQLMVLKNYQDLFKVVDDMSCSICKIWYKNGITTRTNDFKLTEVTRVIFLNDRYNWTDYHPKKIKERFTRKDACDVGDKFMLGDKKHANSLFINRKLSEV